MNGNVYVTDLKSKNGTYVNGIEIYKKDENNLRDDVVFGDATLRLEDAISVRTAAAVSSSQEIIQSTGEVERGRNAEGKVERGEFEREEVIQAQGSGAKKLFEEASVESRNNQKERQIEKFKEEAAANARSVEAQLVPIEENLEEDEKKCGRGRSMRVILGPIGDWANDPVVSDRGRPLIWGRERGKEIAT